MFISFCLCLFLCYIKYFQILDCAIFPSYALPVVIACADLLLILFLFRNGFNESGDVKPSNSWTGLQPKHKKVCTDFSCLTHKMKSRLECTWLLHLIAVSIICMPFLVELRFLFIPLLFSLFLLSCFCGYDIFFNFLIEWNYLWSFRYFNV